ncbi:MAG: hypothetical protein KKF50_01670 [Nanoarchaeota archaeon]|nr:hypothetical protein [Nanoarchaeota archaeon]
MIDIQEKKNKIISFLEMNGPSLPVRIAKAIEMDPVFASAILSELLNAKQIKMSNIKIGASSLYLLPGQEQKLEKYTENLKSIENDAYIKLRERKMLDDEKETPAIRVALRSIKDFAIPFRFNEKIMWKYTFTPDEEIENILTPKKKEPEETPEAPKAWEAKKEEIMGAKEESKKVENIFTSPKKDSSQKKAIGKKSGDETFLEKIKEFLEKQNTKITSIKEVNKKKVIAEVESDSETTLLFAFNKTRINESELMQCYKQARAVNLPYQLIVLGDLTKKMNYTIEAYKKLIKIEKLR